MRTHIGKNGPDPEDLFDDPEERETARQIVGYLASLPKPPVELEPGFRGALRRRLMADASRLKAGRPWYRRLLRPPTLVLAGASAVLLLSLLAVVVLIWSSQPPTVSSPLDRSRAVSVSNPIVITFSQPMDPRSTEKAIEIEPATPVTYHWSSAETLQIKPVSGALKPNTLYQILVRRTAMSARHHRLGQDERITFMTGHAAPAPTPRLAPTLKPPTSPSPPPRTPGSPRPSISASPTPSSPPLPTSSPISVPSRVPPSPPSAPPSPRSSATP